MYPLLGNKMLLKTLLACVCVHFVVGQNVVPGVRNFCLLDPEPGICKAYLPSFYYNKEAKYCDCFVYTGCSGNENRFETLDDCRYSCNVPNNQQIITNTCRNLLRGTPMLVKLLNRTEFQGKDSIKPTKPSAGSPTDVGKGQQVPLDVDVNCYQAPEMGPCRAYLPSYFYDTKNRICDCFVYSGCGGNENRFRNLNDCRVSCDVGPDKQVITKSCKNILQGTSQWDEFLQQLSETPIQDSTIDKIDIRKIPSNIDTSKDTSVLHPNIGSNKDSSFQPSSSGTNKETSFQPSSFGTNKEPTFQSSSSGTNKEPSFKPNSGTNIESSFPTSSSGTNKEPTFQSSNFGNINNPPRFTPKPIQPAAPIPHPPLLPKTTAVAFIFHRIKEIKGSADGHEESD